jgi:hypothetical protein
MTTVKQATATATANANANAKAKYRDPFDYVAHKVP